MFLFLNRLFIKAIVYKIVNWIQHVNNECLFILAVLFKVQRNYYLAFEIFFIHA